MGTAAGRVKEELKTLPGNEMLTQTYCARFGGVLCVDGVYVRVKGWKKATPFIYGIDYETHDVPAGVLDFAESEDAFRHFFTMVKDAGYPLRFVVSDEATALKPALQEIFPDAKVQLCYVHVLRNIKETLGITRVCTLHLPFFLRVRLLLKTRGEEARRGEFKAIQEEYGRNPLYRFVLSEVASKWDDLFRYEAVQRMGIRCPKTTNLIEGYNNHFKARVKNIKGFESFSSAMRFLNAWMIRRRFAPFTDCKKPFKHLNGYSSFEKSRNPDLPWPLIPGLSPPKHPKKGARN